MGDNRIDVDVEGVRDGEADLPVPDGAAPAGRVGGTDDVTRMADRLEDLARMHADGAIGDAECTQRVKAVVEGTADVPAVGDDPPPPPPPAVPPTVPVAAAPDPRRSGGPSKGALIGAGILAGLVIVALVGFLALRGGSDDDADAAGSAASAPLAAYAAATRPVRTRLAASAKVTNRTLERTSSAGDLGPLVRTARQQLAAVNKARADLAELRPQGARARRAHGLLVRATGAHRRLLVGLSRIDRDNPAAGLSQFPAMVTNARAGVAAYGQYAAILGIPAAAVTQEGLADLSGVRQALRSRQTQIAEEAAAQSTSSGGGGGGGGDRGEDSPSSGALRIESVSGQDNGGYLAVYGSYCDRTPGRVNAFAYTATIHDGGTVVASNTITADQTRACNTIEVDITDDLGLGTYTATFTVDNLTNDVSATGSAPITVID